MRLEGIHHITAITGDAPRNVDFYTRVLGLRLAAKTVNQDDPSVYHLFYADEQGRAGLGHHVLRVPRRAARPAPARAWSTRSSGASAARSALDFWEQRLAPRASRPSATATSCASRTPRASATSSRVDDVRRRAAVGRAPRGPGRSTRCTGFDARPRLQLRPGRDRRAARALLGAEPARRRRLGAPRRAPRRPLPPRPRAGASAACRARARSTTSRSARRSPTTREWFERIQRRRRALLAGHRPPLLPLDLLPRAGRRPLRDRRRRPRLHGRRAARGARLEGDPAAEARAAPRARSRRS